MLKDLFEEGKLGLKLLCDVKEGGNEFDSCLPLKIMYQFNFQCFLQHVLTVQKDTVSCIATGVSSVT